MKDIGGVGEVPSRVLGSLRSLIIDIRMFLDLVNVVEKIFEISLLQNELSISFHLSLKFFVCSCTWSEEKKSALSQSDSDIFRRR